MRCEALLNEIEHTIEEGESEGLPNDASRGTFRDQAFAMSWSPLWQYSPATRLAEEDAAFAEMRDLASEIRRTLRRGVYDPLNDPKVENMAAIQRAVNGASAAKELLLKLRQMAEEQKRTHTLEQISRQLGTL